LRGYAVALLMHKGWLTVAELEATVVAHCNIDDLKVGGIDPFTEQVYNGTRLGALIKQLLAEFKQSGLTEWDREKRAWVPALKSLGRHMQFCIALNCEPPPSLRKHIQQGVVDDAKA
jgi:hypothetical protein